MKQKAENSLWNAKCYAFLESHDVDPLELYTVLVGQQAYNGSQSTISTAAAGTAFGFLASTVADGFKSPGVHAAASITSWDVYFRQGGFLFGNSNIQEGTIEHEALHNMLQIYDRDAGGLEDRLGLPQSSSTDEITIALDSHGCAK